MNYDTYVSKYSAKITFSSVQLLDTFCNFYHHKQLLVLSLEFVNASCLLLNLIFLLLILSHQLINLIISSRPLFNSMFNLENSYFKFLKLFELPGFAARHYLVGYLDRSQSDYAKAGSAQVR